MLRTLAHYLSEYARLNPRPPWVRPPGMSYIEEYAFREFITERVMHTKQFERADWREVWRNIDPRDYITDDEMRKWEV